MQYEQDSLVQFSHKIEILGVGFDTGGAVGKKVLGGKSVVGGQVFVGMNNSPFVGEVVEVAKLVVGVVQGAVQGSMLWITVEVMAVVELAEVEIESAKTNQRGLSYGEMAPSISSWRPLLHCLSSSSGSWWSPLVFPGLSGMSFSAFSSLDPWLLGKMLR